MSNAKEAMQQVVEELLREKCAVDALDERFSATWRKIESLIESLKRQSEGTTASSTNRENQEKGEDMVDTEAMEDAMEHMLKLLAGYESSLDKVIVQLRAAVARQ